MGFDFIFTLYPPQIQIAQANYSARDLGSPITIGKRPNFSIEQSEVKIDLPEKQSFNPNILFDGNLLNPDINIKLKKIEQQFGQINSVSTDLEISFLQSKLELDDQELETELTLLSASGFNLEFKGEIDKRDRQMNITPVLSFKQSFNLFQDEREIENNNTVFNQATKLAIPRRIILNSAYLNSLRINQENEIEDLSNEIEDLTDSLDSLTNSKLATKTKFSLEADLEELSAKLEFPFPGILRDELEFQIETNIPEVLVEGDSLAEQIKSKVSLKYGIAINRNTKLKIENSYNLRSQKNETWIIFNYLF